MATSSVAAVVQAHHRRLLALQNVTGRNMGAAWDRLANVDAHAARQFTQSAAAISSASVATAASLSDSMFEVLAPARDSTIAPVVIRKGLEPVDLYQRSIVTARTVLSNGGTWLAAMAAGRARAVSTAKTDVVLANRAAADVQGAARPAVEGFARVLDPGACAYCAALADETYSTADDVPLHNACGCSVAPIIGGHDAAKSLNQSMLRSLGSLSADELASRGFVSAAGDPIDPVDIPSHVTAVLKHGEMGAVITRRGDRFTTAAEEDDTD